MAGFPQEVGLQPALAEQQRVVQEFGAEISQEALNHMEALQRNITEALRINPPLTLLLRQVKKSFAVTTSSGKTHIIPKVPTVVNTFTLAPCCTVQGYLVLPLNHPFVVSMPYPVAALRRSIACWVALLQQY